MSGMKQKKIITFDKGWATVRPLLQSFLDRIEGLDEHGGTLKPKVPQTEYKEVYHQIFEMCNQKDPYNLSKKIWDQYMKTLRKYFKDNTKVALETAQKESQGQGKAILRV